MNVWFNVMVSMSVYIINLISWHIARFLGLKYARCIKGQRIFDMRYKNKKIGSAMSGDILILLGKGTNVEQGLVRHEIIHIRQLRRMGLLNFFKSYATIQGRAELELEAYLEQYAFILRNDIRKHGVKEIEDKINAYTEFIYETFQNLYKIHISKDTLEYAIYNMTNTVLKKYN